MYPLSKYSRYFASLLIASAVTALLVGCGKKEGAATQVVASVDGQEITVQQINTVLSKARGVTPESLPKVKVDILSALVEQQLAVNLAISKKLDRSPEVVAAIETAKRDILARAALDQIAATQAKPTDEEIKNYFNENPALFSERRVFNLQEIAFSASTKGIDQIREKAAAAKSIEEVATWLKEKDIQFSSSAGTRSAEQVPLEVLPKLHSFKDGQVGLIEGKDGYLVIRVVASRSQPVTEAQALPMIKVFLSNQRALELVKLTRDEMKAKAKIEYFGEFAGGEVAFKAKAESDAKAAAEATAQAQAKQKADADALAKQKADEQAAAQVEAEARAKARTEARAQSAKDQPASNKANAVNLEKGIKGLQ